MRLLLLPALVLATATALDQGWLGELPATPTRVWAARGIFAVAFLLAWRFRRGRLAAAALVLAGTAEALPAASPGGPLITGLACLVPLNLAALALLREWRVTSSAGLRRYAVIVSRAKTSAGAEVARLRVSRGSARRS